MFVGSFLLFVIILHFVVKKSLGLGGAAALTLGAIFFGFIHAMTKDTATSAGAALALSVYML